jgi:hypothetical protein
MEQSVTSFNLEEYAARSFNYYSKMVDKDHLPYFNIFWTDPAEAVHDWPDLHDVMTRQLQGIVCGRKMTGIVSDIEKIWYKKTVSQIQPSGLMLASSHKLKWDEYEENPTSQGLVLYALVTAYADNPREDLKKIIEKMCAAVAKSNDKQASEGGGFALKGLMAAVRYVGVTDALKTSTNFVNAVMNKSKFFSPDNCFKHGGHMHSNLHTLMGLADYALYVGDPVLFSRVDALLRYVKSLSTSFGFIPEEVGRHDDITLCETCALMDYMALFVTMANHGHSEYWHDAERLVRNQLAESQLMDPSFIKSDNTKEDTHQFSWRDIGERTVGAYAGWSSPTHFLAAEEYSRWGGPELQGKTRLFQNCCGGSGTFAYYIAWKNAVEWKDNTFYVHMHIDKLTPWAEVRCLQPYRGETCIILKKDCSLKIRIPNFAMGKELGIAINGGKKDYVVWGKEYNSYHYLNQSLEKNNYVVWGNYLELGKFSAGDKIQLTYPLDIVFEDVTLEAPGGRKYCYKVEWKGDTVISIEPVGEEYKTGYSEVEKREVPIYYGKNGPGRLYQREYMRKDIVPAPAPLTMDDGSVNFWRNLTAR